MMIVDGIQISWSPEKAARNLRKHKLAFEAAAYVFEDRDRVEDYDRDHSNHEQRLTAIGKAKGEYVTVVYTDRSEDDDDEFLWLVRPGDPTRARSPAIARRPS